ncbi:hypothetical protein SLEP1_g3420 [Rubroshorea leprosula]|uniref:non-specific serine/threonine protein kinase n=1 Tax=Rubroshorea leprosula TaxID=152421 RepID=A0AAV5HUX2_9ROSI|nr:hypothetical protein SLEP1_g3420 [Rubroshorea leprosula]
MSPDLPSLRQKLLRQTNFFGLRLWVLIVAPLALAILVLLFLLCLYHVYCRPRKSYSPHYRLPNSILATSNCPSGSSTSSLRRLLPLEIEAVMQGNQLVSDRWSSSSSRIQKLVGELESGGRWSSASVEAWRGYMFTIKDIELATNCFSEKNVIGKRENGVVYGGILLDRRRIAVKRLIYKKYPLLF